MAQVQLSNNSNSLEQEVQIIATDDSQKRKVNLCIGEQHYISVFKNEDCETVINVRKGTRSVTISTKYFMEICDLKETILTCCSFVGN